MGFDWITWSIWLTGFVILVVWIWMPLRELRRLLHQRRQPRSNDDGAVIERRTIAKDHASR